MWLIVENDYFLKIYLTRLMERDNSLLKERGHIKERKRERESEKMRVTRIRESVCVCVCVCV